MNKKSQVKIGQKEPRGKALILMDSLLTIAILLAVWQTLFVPEHYSIIYVSGTQIIGEDRISEDLYEEMIKTIKPFDTELYQQETQCPPNSSCENITWY